MNRTGQRGIAHVLVTVIVVVLLILGAAGYLVFRAQRRATDEPARQSTTDSRKQSAAEIRTKSDLKTAAERLDTVESDDSAKDKQDEAELEKLTR